MTTIKSIEALGVHGRFDIHQEFTEGINIIYGANGAGKTTLLHIIANALSGDFDRLKYLQFKKITIVLSDGRTTEITSKSRKDEPHPNIEARINKEKVFPPDRSEQIALFETAKNKFKVSEELLDLYRERLAISDSLEDEKIINLINRQMPEPKQLVDVAYFPAFRTMIEAWSASTDKREFIESSTRRRYSGETWKNIATKRARDWFGEFTPMVNFPSLVDMEEQLSEEIAQAGSNVIRTDQALFSDAFLKIFASLSAKDAPNTKAEDLLGAIQELFNKLEQLPLRAESRINNNKLREEIGKLTKGGNTDATALRTLQIYRETLESTLRVRESSFSNIEKFFSSVNEFLDGKSIVFRQDVVVPRRQSVQIQFADGSLLNGLRALSFRRTTNNDTRICSNSHEQARSRID